MGTSAFRQGVTVEIRGDTLRLIRKLADGLWQLEEDRTKRIHQMTDTQLRGLYADGDLKFASRTRLNTPLPEKVNQPSDYRPDQWEAAKVRRMYVEAILQLPSTKRSVAPVIRAQWETMKLPAKCPSSSAVLRWKKCYLEAGRDVTTLIDQDHKKGNRQSRYPAEVEGIVQDAIDAKYMTLERGTIQDTIDHSLWLLSKVNEERPIGMELSRPTRRLVARKIAEISAEERCDARYGRIVSSKRFRAALRTRTSDGPFERAEMDHTLLDVFVIDEEHRLALGRPWLTVCLDTYTRCVLGFYIGFEEPSYLSVSRCLEHSFLPKTYLKEKYPKIQNPWVQHGVMRVLSVDNGREFHSNSLINACYSLGIEIQYSPRKKAWYKGHVERFIGTLNRGVAHTLPGKTFADILEKSDYDPAKHALATLTEIRERAHIWVCDIYHAKLHRALQMSPSAMWSKYVRDEDIEIPDDCAVLRAILGRSEQRKLSNIGIEINCLFYNSIELHDIMRRYGAIDVDVRIDDGDLGYVHVLPPDGGSPIRVSVREDALPYAAGLSRWQHERIRKFAALKLKESSGDLSGWIVAKAMLGEMVGEWLQKRRRGRKKAARFQGEGSDSRIDPAAAVNASRRSSSQAESEAATGSNGTSEPSHTEFDEEPDLPPFDVVRRTQSRRNRRVGDAHEE